MPEKKELIRVGLGRPLEVMPTEVIARRLMDKSTVEMAVGDGWRTIVCDVDEVVAPIVPKWVCLAVAAGLAREDEVSPERVIGRPVYDICDWLGVAPERMFPLYGEDFYDDLPPTTFGNALQLINASGNGHIVFITHTVERTRRSKDAWLARYFPRTRVIHLPAGASKSKAIRENIPEYSTFVDDRPDVLGHAVLHTTSFGKEFIMPAFGYNEDVGPVLRHAVQLGLVTVSRFEHRY